MPGLFSRYGLFGNPLVDLLGAASIASAAQQGALQRQQREMLPDPTSQRFANYAAMQGQMADSIPRAPSFFGNIGQALGILGPNISPRGKDIAAEIEAIDKERAIKLADLKDEVGLRKTLGAENYATLAGTPAMQDITKAATGRGLFGIGGTKELDLRGLTPEEAKTAGLERYRESEEAVANKRIALTQQEIDLTARRLALLEKKPQLGTREYNVAIAQAAAARTAAEETTKTTLYNNDWNQWDRVNKGQLQYYDKQKLRPVDRTIVKTPLMASNDPIHYKQVNAKGAVIMDKLNNQIDRANQMINDVAVIFPDTRNMNRADKALAITKWALANHTVDRYNKNVREFGELREEIIGYIKELQQRYPTTIELKTIGEGSFPSMWGDGREDAIGKMRRLISSLRNGADAATDEENKLEMNNAAAADYNTRTYGYESPETGAEPTIDMPKIPEGMSPPPAGYSTEPSAGGGTP